MSDTNPAPTPRTDAMQASGKAHYMSLDLARTLERELAAKDEAIAQLLRSSAHLAIDRDQLRARVADLERQLAEAGENKARLADAAEEVLDSYIISKKVEAGHPCPENMVICCTLRGLLDAARDRKEQP